MNTVLVRVFIGAHDAPSRKFFDAARGEIIGQYGKQCEFQVLNTDDMKRDPFRFTPAEFIDWLIEGDVHVLVGHMHQGVDHLNWDMKTLLEEYKRLKDHVGYPRGAQDPVFLQDKIQYLEALDAEDILPTLKVEMPLVSANDEVLILESDLNAIIAFISQWGGTYKDGWVVKTPFTTHGSIYRNGIGSGSMYCNDLQEIAKRILCISRLSHHHFTGRRFAPNSISLPYIFIQPRVENSELKLLVINGEAKLHVCKATYSKAFKTNIHACYDFADKVVKKLKSVHSDLMIEYILRVDLFEISDGAGGSKLVVNEFESFDADFLQESEMRKKRKRDENWTDHSTENFILTFWVNKMKDLIEDQLLSAGDQHIGVLHS